MSARRLAAARSFLSAGNTAAAERELGLILTDDPNHPLAHALLAQLHVKCGHPDKARPHLQTAMAVAPTDPEVLLAAFAHALNVDAYDQARLLASTVARILPDSALHLECQAQIALLEGDFVHAAQILRQAIERSLEDPDLHLLLGLAHEAMDQPDLAWDAAQQALRLAPERGDAHLLVARCTLQTGDAEQAEHHAQQALRLCPDDDDAVRLLLNIQARRSPWLGLWWRVGFQVNRRPLTWFAAALLVLVGLRTGLQLAGLHHWIEAAGLVGLLFAVYVGLAGAWFERAMARARKGVDLSDY